MTMTGLQGGEREYPVHHLVLGHDAEADRQRPFRPPLPRGSPMDDPR